MSHGPFSAECHTSSTRVTAKTSRLNIKNQRKITTTGKSSGKCMKSDKSAVKTDRIFETGFILTS